jgi:LPXTG-motif cell wall-anchored protein
MTFAAVDVTLRVGGGVRAGSPGQHTDVARGALPVTGAALVTLVAAAIAMIVLGIFLLHARREEER